MADQEVPRRSKSCKNCRREFSYLIGPGADRVHCGPKCRAAHQRALRLPKSEWPRCASTGCGATTRALTSRHCNRCYSAKAKARAGTCVVHKCAAPATRAGDLCEKHYYRVRRSGVIPANHHEAAMIAAAEPPPRVEIQVSSGYVLRKASGHQMANRGGWAYEHRLVAFDLYGPGPHGCHWCGVSEEWPALVVDHLNEIKNDNSPANLVVSCSPCNRARGAMIPFIRRMSEPRVSELVATFKFMRSRP